MCPKLIVPLQTERAMDADRTYRMDPPTIPCAAPAPTVYNARSSPMWEGRSARGRRSTSSPGFMYSRSFFDLDGHGSQVTWIEPAALEKDAETIAASMHHADAAA